MPESHVAESQREMLSLVTARVRDAYVRKPFYVDGALDLVSVCRLLPQQGLHRRAGAGRQAATPGHLHHHRPARRAAARRAAGRAGGARGGAFRAGRDPRRRRTVRGAVADGAPPRAPRCWCATATRVLGVLGQLDLVSFVANHSHIVARADRRGRLGGRPEGRGAAHRRDGRPAARQRHQIERITRPGARAQPPPLRAAVGPARAAGAGGQQLPAGDGQRRPRRADPQDRPGQRAAAARRLRAPAACRDRGELQRRAGRVRLPAVPRPDHAHQPAVALHGLGLPRHAARVDLRGRPGRADAPGDLLSTPPPWPATPRCCRRCASTWTASSPAATPSWRASRRRPTSSTSRSAGGSG